LKLNKILAASIIVASSAPLPVLAETSNFNVYGNFDVSYDSINTGTATNGTSGTTTNRVSSNTSFIGVKGSVDAGDNLTAIWQLESLLNVGDAAANGTPTGATTNNGIGYLGSRNTYVGLKNDGYGTILAGRYDTPYRLSTRRLDVFDRGIADSRSITGGSNVAAKVDFDGRQDQVVEYLSPKLQGITFAVAQINLNPTVNLASQYQGNATSVAALYDVDGLFGSLSYEEHNLQNSATLTQLGSEHASKIGLGYTQDRLFTVGLLAEQTADNLGTSGSNLYGHNAYYISGKYFVGSAGAIKAAYTSASNLGGGNTANTRAQQTTLGYDYSLSKHTTLYALYTKLSNESAAAYSLSIYNGTAASIGGPTTIAGTGASPSAVAAGVLVTF
jgi:predicted porin